MMAGIGAAVRLGEGRDIDAAAPELEHVVGPSRARRIDRRAAQLASGQQMGQRPFFAPLQLDVLHGPIAAVEEKPAAHGCTPTPSRRAATTAGSNSPRRCFSIT